MVMSSRPGAENPTAKDYRIPTADGTAGRPSTGAPMPTVREIDPAARNIGAGTGNNEATQDTGHNAPHPAPRGGNT
jgi:hypothetical protein